MAETPQRTVVNFKEDCVDPLAKLVLMEAMSFAVEKAESRMKSLGDIFPGLQTAGQPIIQDIKDIRFAVENLNVCKLSGEVINVPPSAPPSAETIKTYSKREQEIIKQMPAELQAMVAQELERTKPAAVKKPEEPEKKERTLPTGWGPLEYDKISYTSPGAFLRELHGGNIDEIRGKGNYLKQLDEEGFEVYVGGKLVPPNLKKEEVEKLKGSGMVVKTKKGVARKLPVRAVVEVKEERPKRLLAIQIRDEKDPKKLKQIGWDVLDEEGHAIKRLALDEGTKLVLTGQARIE